MSENLKKSKKICIWLMNDDDDDDELFLWYG